jgi:hypothetical protein
MLELAAFDPMHPFFHGNTVADAHALPGSGRLPKLLALITSLQRCASGEALARCKWGRASTPS